MLTMDGVPRTLSHRYREDGNRTRITHPDLQAFTYDYDALGRPSGVYEGIGTTVMLDQFTYNPQGLPASRSERYGSSVAYGYDPIGRLASLTDAFVGGTGNVALGFGYNPASQIVSRSRNNDAYASNTAYDLSRTYTVNGLNQYSTRLSGRDVPPRQPDVVEEARRLDDRLDLRRAEPNHAQDGAGRAGLPPAMALSPRRPLRMPS